MAWVARGKCKALGTKKSFTPAVVPGAAPALAKAGVGGSIYIYIYIHIHHRHIHIYIYIYIYNFIDWESLLKACTVATFPVVPRRRLRGFGVASTAPLSATQRHVRRRNGA